MTRRTLDEWLDYQQRVHALGVDLGLARVHEVWRRMGAPQIAPIVITVGGTNGKGSTVAFLEAMLTAAGRRVGCYTSPHLLRYNERVRVAGGEVADAVLIDAFERIETSRGEISLTYFEFGTLAALWIFAHSGLDAAILEVGLGGRLDAVNIIDADAAIVTTIDLDHQDWLGNDRDSIAREKAGIFRSGRPAIVGDVDAPVVLLQAAEQAGANLFCAGRDYRIAANALDWSWQAADLQLVLPNPLLAAPVQRANAAAAIATLYTLRERIDVSADAFASGVRNARVAARLQRFGKPGVAELVIDVAHNPQAARVLAQWLDEHRVDADAPRGRNLAVFGALADKDIAGIVAPLAPHIARWFVGGLDADTPRGLPAADLAVRMTNAVAHVDIETQPAIARALDAAARAARESDRILAFGSFFVAAAALEWARQNGFRAVDIG
ncbi:MAG TPA: bifunctional tetrahydrofolate synthase/dihydrofolate synthase [Rudaea sp.]|jgi:dihydrofolate synthase/folylpolyglutamate synthase|uniref:bifunctional tetrahydrofolate synthase/dihydrofolate synthase n=1 Tax=Rudaea sp. TaxID=2136325 RepID=UPI002F92AEB5